MLLFIIIIIIFLIYKIYKKNNKYHDPLIKKIKYDVSLLDSRITNLNFYSSDESYTEDKHKIYLCLKDENGKYYDYNMLLYVAIHECSHALTKVVDVKHITPEFRNMFEHLLRKATQMKIYTPETPLEKYYCGITLKTESMQR